MADRENQADKLRAFGAEHGIAPPNGTDQTTQALNSDRPKVKLPGDHRELSQFATEIGQHIVKRGLYRRDRTPVMINDEKRRLDLMTPDTLRTWVEQHLVCFKEKGIGQNNYIQITRTMRVEDARGTLESVQFLRQLDEVDRVNETKLPVITEGSCVELLRVGYFDERRIYTFDDGMQLSDTMTLEEAKHELDELLRYFPFANDRSKAVAIAAMLTLFCANMLPKNALRPGFIYTANSPGAGKTLLAKIAIIPSAGSAATRTFPRKEEAKKVLDVIAMDAMNYVLFDNIRGKIAGEEIEAFITSPIWEGRVLGESTKFRVDNVTTVFLTGNQSTTSGDMADRCLFVELFVQEADNRDRKIPHPIDDDYLAAAENRTRILSALWALVRYWDAEGRPPAPTVMPRFDAWSRVVASVVACAGYGDPVAKPELQGLGDTELADMRELVQALAPEDDELRSEHKFHDIIEKARELGLFADVEIRAGRSLEEMFDEQGVTPAGKSYFGKLLPRYNRRVFAIRSDGGIKALRFVVEGKGNTRKFAVLDETPQAATSTEDVQPF